MHAFFFSSLNLILQFENPSVKYTLVNSMKGLQVVFQFSETHLHFRWILICQDSCVVQRWQREYLWTDSSVHQKINICLRKPFRFSICLSLWIFHCLSPYFPFKRQKVSILYFETLYHSNIFILGYLHILIMTYQKSVLLSKIHLK